MRIEGCPVHQERRHVIEFAAQLVQDAETVGVDIAPVIDDAVLQPLAARHGLPAVTGAKYNDGVGD